MHYWIRPTAPNVIERAAKCMCDGILETLIPQKHRSCETYKDSTMRFEVYRVKGR